MTEPRSTLTAQQRNNLTLGDRLAFQFFKFFLVCSSHLSLSTSRRIGRSLGWFYYKLAKKRVHIARVNLQICFPELTEAERSVLLKESFFEAGSWFMEAGAIWMWPSEKILRHVKVNNPELFESALAEEHGVVLAIPHLGNWEVMGPYVSLATEFACFYRHDKGNPLFSDFLVQLRSRNGTVMAPADPSGVRILYKHVKAGKVIGLLPDHNPSREMGIFAPFFGRPALTGTLISSLARKNKAKVLSAAAIRTEKGFEIYFAEIPDQHNEDPLVAATALNLAIEDCIRLAPAQFHWVYPRFARRQFQHEQSPYRHRE